jgi:hypothetical protein
VALCSEVSTNYFLLTHPVAISSAEAEKRQHVASSTYLYILAWARSWYLDIQSNDRGVRHGELEAQSVGLDDNAVMHRDLKR